MPVARSETILSITANDTRTDDSLVVPPPAYNLSRPVDRRSVGNSPTPTDLRKTVKRPLKREKAILSILNTEDRSSTSGVRKHKYSASQRLSAKASALGKPETRMASYRITGTRKIMMPRTDKNGKVFYESFDYDVPKNDESLRVVRRQVSASGRTEYMFERGGVGNSSSFTSAGLRSSQSDMDIAP